jgi:hypothetical protein
MNGEIFGRKRSWLNLRYYPNIDLQEVKKTKRLK